MPTIARPCYLVCDGASGAAVLCALCSVLYALPSFPLSPSSSPSASSSKPGGHTVLCGRCRRLRGAKGFLAPHSALPLLVAAAACSRAARQIENLRRLKQALISFFVDELQAPDKLIDWREEQGTQPLQRRCLAHPRDPCAHTRRCRFHGWPRAYYYLYEH